MTKTELANQIIEKYIQISLKTKQQFSKRYLAKILFDENSDVFKDAEDARSFIRYSLNSYGDKHRSKSKEELTRQFAFIPEHIKELENTEPFIIPTSIKKSLVIADVHGRFYNKKAFEIALEYGIKQNCNSVIINGDFVDFYGESKFDKNPAIAKIMIEQEWGQDILEMLQNLFGSVYLKEGNHDLRRQLHIQRISRDMPDMVEFSKYSDYLFFDGCHVNFIEDYRHIIFGKLNIFHGHEYQGGGGIHVAHNRFNKTLENSLSAHSHIPQSIIKHTINDNILGSWTMGCLCDLKPRYNPKNNWNNGFTVVEKDSSGEFNVDNRIIIGNKTVSI